MRWYFDGGMLWGFLNVKIKDYLGESWTRLLEKFHERGSHKPKQCSSFNVIMMIVDPWLETLNKCFYF
jgi:hypothetical protein